MCKPGETMVMKREPKNPADSRAIGVYPLRGVQIGYVPAEQAQWIGQHLADIRAVFQRDDTFGAVIRVTFDGTIPTLPVEQGSARPRRFRPRDDDWPPPEPKDDYSDV
ncbi:HIRAN domain-containing protein [Sphingobium phenoxybenzoativorans]|uniref:HIRAN domain-containing protein n=1 Tax=Sphingobium phenoxybenzoativorans TaxID=1592790 RepID=A0A975KBF3_9SPHN|nr:HIRAN domain-containing protein [Sphingobium phenoxybenzoativorans]